jgi:transcriptional regulator with XRE-family HTH domain
MKPNIGENIKKLRAEKQVTQEQLAEHLSISYQAVSKWENNVTTPDIFLLPAIAEYFEVPIDELFKANMKGYKNKAHRLFALYDCRGHTTEQFYKADEEYQKLIAENKADGEDMRRYGLLNEFHAGFLIKKAEEAYKKAIEMGNGERVEGQLIGLLARYGRNQENIDKYEELIKNEPENGRWWNLLSSSYGLETEKGVNTVKQGLQKFPDDAGLLYRQADICRFQKKYDEAIKYYKKSVEQNPDIGGIYYAMAFLYKDMKKYKEAIWAWEEVIALHGRLGMAYEQVEMETEWPKQEIAKLRELLQE